jgi:hypothetical protein
MTALMSPRKGMTMNQRDMRRKRAEIIDVAARELRDGGPFSIPRPVKGPATCKWLTDALEFQGIEVDVEVTLTEIVLVRK